MILAFSTSSPWASVAILSSRDRDAQIVWSGQRHAPQGASTACMALLDEAIQELGISMAAFDAYAADIGPGSFTGVRVGVMLAKTFAFVHNKQVVGADAFDLISADAVVVMPSKRGEFFVRVPGSAPVRQEALPTGDYVGFGPGVEPSIPPHAKRFRRLLERLDPVDPIAFAPDYLIEPSISTPKKPYSAPSGVPNA